MRHARWALAPVIALLTVLAACSPAATPTAQTDVGTEPAIDATTESAVALDTAGCGQDASEDRPVVEITAVEYAFQGVPETVEPGTQLCLFNAGEQMRDLYVTSLGEETASIDELIPPEGAFVGVINALPGEYGQALVRSDGGGP